MKNLYSPNKLLKNYVQQDVSLTQQKVLIRHRRTMEAKKKETEIGFLWHKYAALFVFQTAIVTTADRSGLVNAAPFSLVYPFCVGDPDKPQMLFSAASVWHTARNIEETGEFVINYAPYALMKQVCETGRFYPDGINELEKAGLHAVAAVKVKPPRIQECYQHIECRLP